MATSRPDSTSLLSVDPSLQALLADVDSIRSRICSYIEVDRARRELSRRLENELCDVQRELGTLRRENTQLKHEIQTTRADPPTQTSSGRGDGQPDVDELRRQLRHSYRIDADEGPAWLSQASVMSDSPSAHHDHARAHTITPLKNARTSSAQASQLVDEPEQASPVQRTPRVKKTQSYSVPASQVSPDGSGLEDLNMPHLRSAPPAGSRTKQSRQARMEAASDVDAGRASSSSGANVTQSSAQSPGDPWQTDVTYYGPEEDDTDVEVISGPLRPSEVAKGKKPEIRRTQSLQDRPSSLNINMLLGGFPNSMTTYRLPGIQKKILEKLECPPDVINRYATSTRIMNEGVDALITDYSVDALKGSTSFHLAVHGANLYIADPIFLETSTQILLLNWGKPGHNQAVSDAVWGDGQLSATYHTFVRFRVQQADGKKKEWHYAGLLRWDHFLTESKWPRFIAETRRNLANYLQARWGVKSELSWEDIADKIERDELQQLCVELSSDEETRKASVNFMRQNFPEVVLKGTTKSASAATV